MRNDFESNYLMHHGILGQKWGQRNGPPYPLDAGDHSASEKKAGYKKSISGDGKESSKKWRRRKNASKPVDESEINKKAVDAAKKAGLDQGDNWKVYRDAQAGDKKSQEVIKKWESDKNSSKLINEESEANKKAIDAAIKAGLNQGDNWKVYRDAQAGDKKSQEVIKKWESDKNKYQNSDGSLTKKATNKLLKNAKYDKQKEDIKKFSKMSEKEFNSELKEREKFQKQTMNESLTKSESRAEQIAKSELAEQAFNDYARMLLYQKSVEKLINENKNKKI